MRYYYRENDWWHIGFDYNPRLVAEVKKFNGAGYNPENKEWYVPAFIATDPAVVQWLKENGFTEGMIYTPSPWVLSYVEPENVVSIQDVLEGCRALGLKRTPRHYQAEGIAYMLNHGNCINGDSCGLGKAQPLTTKIITPTGYTLLGDIKVGDKILHPFNGVQTVEKVYEQGVKKMFRVIFTDKTFTYCCDEHLWSVTMGGSSKIRTLSLAEMMKFDIHSSSAKKEYRWGIPVTNGVEYEFRKIDLDPYLLGLLLGDGGLSRGVGFTTADPEIFEYVKLPKDYIFYKRKSENITYHIIHKDKIGISGGENIVKNILRKYGLTKTHSDTKFIPKDYLYNTKEIRLEVLRGLLDTDGYISENCGHISYSTVSRQLADDVKQLVWSLGGIVRERSRIGKYRRSGRIIECKRSYRLSIMLPKEIIPFKLKRKVERINQNRKYLPKRKIKSIEYAGEAPMRCIKVSEPDGLYMCDDWIVTHNTGQSICTCEILGCFPVLVICPASVKYNWKKEWARWNPDRTVGVVDPRLSKRKRENLPNPWECDVTVINFDLLSGGRTERGDLKPRFKELMKRMWQGCVIDEIHFLKNERAIRSRMAKRICKTIPNVWGLTGTLTQNRPADLIGPYTVLRRFTEMFNNSLAFKFRYCDAKKTVFGFDWSGASNLEELHELLRMGGYIRRDKRDVLKELPPLVSEYVDVPLSNASEYGEAEENLIKYLNESGQEERVDSALNAEFLVQLNILRQLCIEGKLDFIRKYVKDWLDANENDSLVIFGVHKEPLALLAEEFKCPVIQGGVTPAKRQEIVEGFIARKYRVLVCNIQAAGTGMDGLQQASSNMFFVEYPDRYTDIEQTVARLERMGQTMPVTVTYLMASGTVDEDYRDMLNDKRSITQTVNDGQSELEFLKRKFRMGKGFKREVR